MEKDWSRVNIKKKMLKTIIEKLEKKKDNNMDADVA